jgi:phosphoadenosine phosphosulfate reductase
MTLDLHDCGDIVKINPGGLMMTCWNYICAHDVPFNRLHEQGYPSIGCAPRTRPVNAGEGLRTGRWWWENPVSKERGLHLSHDAPTNSR